MLGKKAFRAALMASCLMAATGCASVPDLGDRPIPAEPATLANAKSFSGPAAEWPADRWWMRYGDAQLNALIEEGLAASPDLAAAAARMRQAQGASQQAGAARLPSLGAKSSTTGSTVRLSGDDVPQTISDNLPNDWTLRTEIGLKLDYQLDFFGRNRAAFAAATSSVKAAEAEEAAARLQLSTAIASTYAQLTQLYAERAAGQESVRIREASAALVTQKLDVGVENEGQAAQAESSLEQARADLTALDGAIVRARNQLAALMGKGPDRGIDIAVPATPTLVAFGVPGSLGVDMVGRRPDLAAARQRAEAAAHRIDVARADFYPNINLSALIGLQTLGLDRIDGGALSMVQAGPAVSLPIFSGERLSGAYTSRRGEYDEAVALYNKTLVAALRETADAVSDRRSLDEELEHSRLALSAAERAYGAVRQRYDAGVSSYIDVLTIENGLVAQRRAFAALQTRAFALDVALVRALGGGFAAS